MNYSLSLDFQTFLLLSLNKSDPVGVDYRTEKLTFPRGSTKQAAFAFIEAGLDAGIVDPLFPVQTDGGGALDLWAQTFGWDLPLSVVEKVAAIAPGLGPRNKDGLSPLPAYFLRINKEHQWRMGPQQWPMLMGWVELAPLEVFNELDVAGALPFSGLVNHFNPYLSSESWKELLGSLQKKGLVLEDHLELWGEQSTPAIVTALLELGLDPFAACPDGSALWSKWTGYKVAALNEVLAPLVDQQPEAKRATELSAYWAGFFQVGSRSASNSVQSTLNAHLLEHLFSREDWVTATDELGRSGLFYLTLVAPASLRAFLAAVPKDTAEQALQHRDAQGRNIWFYVLATSGKSTWTDKLTTLLHNHMPTSYDNDGRGVALQWALMRARSERAWLIPGNDSYNKATPPLPALKNTGLIDWDFLKSNQWRTPQATEARDRKDIAEAFFLQDHTFIKTVLPPGPGPLNERFEAMRYWNQLTHAPEEFLRRIEEKDTPSYAAWQILKQTSDFPVPLSVFDVTVERLKAKLDSANNISTRQREEVKRMAEQLRLGVRGVHMSKELPAASAPSARLRF